MKENYNIGLVVNNFVIYKNLAKVVEDLRSYFIQSNIYIVTKNLDQFDRGTSNLLYMNDIDSIIFDLVLFTDPYVKENQMNHLMEIPNLKKGFINYAPLWSYDPILHFQLAFYKEMDLILCYSDYEVKNFHLNGIEIEKLKLVPDLVKSHISLSVISAQISRKYFLLWTPHWTDYWYGYPFGYGGWYLYVGILYRFALKNSNLLFLVRPHPFFEKTLADYRQEGIIDKSPIGRGLTFWDKFIELDNVTMSESSLEYDLLSAKYLVTDPSTPMVYADAAKIKTAVFRFKGSPPLSEIGYKSLVRHFKVNRISLYFWLICGKFTTIFKFNINFLRFRRSTNSKQVDIHAKSVNSYMIPLEELLKK